MEGLSSYDIERAGDIDLLISRQFAAHFSRYWLQFNAKIQAEVREIQRKALIDILLTVLDEPLEVAGKPLDWNDAYAQVQKFLQRQMPVYDINAKMATFRKAYKSRPLLQQVVKRIDKVENEIEIALSPRTLLEGLITRLFTGNKKVLFKETAIEVVGNERELIGLSSLSSGEMQLLFIFIRVLAAGASSLIIDEPELSLHIDWQREFVKAATELNPHMQLLAATHSPEVLAEVPDEYITRLD